MTIHTHPRSMRSIGRAASFVLAGLAAINGGCGTGLDETAPENTVAVFESTLDSIDAGLKEGTAREAIDEAVQRLSGIDAFSSVELSTDGTTIILQDHDGNVTYFDAAPAEQFYPPADAATLFAPRARVRTARMVAPAPAHASKNSSRRQRGRATPGSRKAALLAPFPQAQDFDPSIPVALISAGYTVKSLKGSDVTLKALIEILSGGYGFVAISTHGGVGLGGRTFFTLGEDFDPLDDAYLSLPPDVRAGIQPYVNRKGWFGIPPITLPKSTCFITRRCFRFSVDSRVIEAFTYPNTFVWLGGCSSLQKDDMARAFCDHGAGAYFGYKRSIVSWLGRAIFKRFMEEFASAGTTARGAYIATRYDKELFFNRPTFYGHGVGDISSVEDLAFRVCDADARLLFDAAPPKDELGETYNAETISHASAQNPILPSRRINFRIGADGSLGGFVQEDDADGKPGPDLAITEGLLEGVNLYFCYKDKDGLDVCMSGRALPALLLPTTFGATFDTIIGSSWFKADLLLESPKRIDSGTWPAFRE